MTEQISHLDLIRKHLPELQIDTVTENHEGLVNDVVIINGEWVFRFPKADWATAALQNEARILTIVSQYVELPAPELTLHAGDFSVHKMITGEPLMRHDLLRLPEAIQDRIAEQLGTFLRQLHTIPPDVLQQAQIPLAASHRTIERWQQLYDDMQREAFPLMMKPTQAVVHAIFAPLMQDSSWLDHTPCLTHGDLAQYHILYDASAQRLNGVIDFGVGGMGDPAGDLGLIINVYGESFLRRIGRYYPALPQHLDRARFYASTLELQWLLGGLRSQDMSWFTVHLDRARDQSPYGLS